VILHKEEQARKKKGQQQQQLQNSVSEAVCRGISLDSRNAGVIAASNAIVGNAVDDGCNDMLSQTEAGAVGSCPWREARLRSRSTVRLRVTCSPFVLP
jgi:hypothetical protein